MHHHNKKPWLSSYKGRETEHWKKDRINADMLRASQILQPQELYKDLGGIRGPRHLVWKRGINVKLQKRG
jgi:hypothetical protein